MSANTNNYLVRLKPYDPRRGHVLRRYTYKGIKFSDDRGWYKVTKAVADYLRDVHQEAGNEHSPPAFDVCSEAEAQEINAREHEETNPRKGAADDIKVSAARDEASDRQDQRTQGKSKAKGR
jgi:hypothetical protein